MQQTYSFKKESKKDLHIFEFLKSVAFIRNMFVYN